MLVRDLEPADFPFVDDLVQSLWAEDELWGASRSIAYQPGDHTVVLAAGTGPELIGLASLRTSSRASFGVLQLDVAAAHQRSGVGRALLTEMRRRHPQHSMMTRIRPWDPSAVAFYAAAGFRVAETALEGWLQPRDPELSGWIDETLQTLPGNCEISVVAGDDDPGRRRVATLLDGWYERHHDWLPAPLRRMPDPMAAFVEPSLPGTAHLASVEGHHVGAGVLIPDPFERVDRGGHLAYLGTARSHPMESALVEGLIAACLGVARAQERSVQVEVSDRHRAAWATMKALPTDDLYAGLRVLVG